MINPLSSQEKSREFPVLISCVDVKSFDHEKGEWMERLERQIKPGNPGFPPSRK